MLIYPNTYTVMISYVYIDELLTSLKTVSTMKASVIFMNVVPRSTMNTNGETENGWVRFPPRSKDFFFASCGSLIPFTKANAQWVIHGFN